MTAMIKPEFSAPSGKSVVGIFADHVVASASAIVVREGGRRVSVFERFVRAGGCNARVWMVVDVGPRSPRKETAR